MADPLNTLSFVSWGLLGSAEGGGEPGETIYVTEMPINVELLTMDVGVNVETPEIAVSVPSIEIGVVVEDIEVEVEEEA
jgi:hypothetical protein